ncbi:enoyl-CoA hydratase/isomerase family protein [bacterium]|nr:enoyl-CoA hydratase/isomerase family protein [bacterium]
MIFPYKSQFFSAERVESGIVLVTFAWEGNPLNNISDAVVEDLEMILDVAAVDEEVIGMIITGKGPVFSTGAYLPELAEQDMYGALHLSRKGTRVFSLLERMPYVTCAAINGLCLGGGLELALACDLRTASVRARLGQTEVTLGLIPGWGGAQRLVMSVGMQRARELVLTGRQLRAAEALRIGLVLSVHPHKELLPATFELLRPIVAAGRTAIDYAKKSLHLIGDTSFHSALETQSTFFSLTWKSPRAQHLVREFIAKQQGKGAKGKKGG